MVNLWRIDCVLKERKSIDLCMGNCLTNFSIEVHFHKSNKCFFVCCKSFGWLKFNIHCWASFIKQTIQWTMCVCVFWKIKTLPYHFSCYFHLSSCWLQFFGVFFKTLPEIKHYVCRVNLLLNHFQYNWHSDKQLWMCYCFLRIFILLTAS